VETSYGQGQGVNSFYKTILQDTSEPSILPSASLLAVRLARATDAAFPKNNPLLYENNERIFFLQYRVGNMANRWPDSGSCFYRISASNIFMKDANLSCIKKAIVIIGASHSGSDDVVHTALGDMPGALVHSNMALQLQTEIYDNTTTIKLITFMWDVIIIAINALLYTIILHDKMYDWIKSKLKEDTKLSYTMRAICILGTHIFFYLLVIFWPLIIFMCPYTNGILFQQVRQYALLMSLCMLGIEISHKILKYAEDKIR